MIACGGTGGHITPGMALGNALKEELPDFEIMYIFSDKKITQSFLKSLKDPYVIVREIQIRGLRNIIQVFARTMGTLIKISMLLFKKKIVLVIGFGSATSFVAVFAGFLFLKPCVVLEQNAVMGRANRIASLLVRRIYLTLPLASGAKSVKYCLTGNPMRQTVSGAISLDKESIRRQLGLSPEGLTLLILGGSQGARSLNQFILSHLDRLLKEIPEIQFIHLSGPHFLEELRAAYKKSGAGFYLASFDPDIGRLYRAADVAMSRAGASTISELSYFGIPTFFVPYPFACDDHQKRNADFLYSKGGAVVVSDEDIETDAFFETMKEVLRDREKRKRMSSGMKEALLHQASAEIIRDIKQVI